MIKQLNKLIIVGLLFSGSSIADWAEPELSHSLSPVTAVVVAKDFELKNEDEEKIKLSAYKGKVVMLNFWATWCPPCIREMPSMQRLQQKIGKDKFEVMAVNQMENEDDVFAFTASLSVEPTFSILYDKKSRVAQAYGVRGLPTTYVIDKKGNIRYHAIGGRDFDHKEIIQLIEKLKAE